ncbi:UNVERIFIED_CONTAM: ttc30a [Trichonephila clavipes]
MAHINDGEHTKAIYTMIKEGLFKEAIAVLNKQFQANTNSRAALSLLGYCYYFTQDFVNAANCYEHLTAVCPEVDDYKLYYAQSLYQACFYQEAMKVTCQIENPDYQAKIVKLQAAIKYGEEDLAAAKSLVDQSPSGDPDTEVNLGCLLFKEGRYEEACKKFMTAMQVEGYVPDLSYNIALCYYRLKQYALALKHIAEIIERGIREHPELSVGMNTEGIEVRSVGNTITLHETALIEAFNLKAAIEYQLKNFDAAKEALTDMPPRGEEELDPVTLHNQALMNMETHPTEGFEKLQFLIQQNPFPPETFGNLLLLYCKHEYYDLAADVLAENAHLTYKYLTPYLFDFLDALITQQTSPEEAYKKFDEMAARHIETLRKLTKQVQEARQNHDDEGVKKAVNECEEALERYIPVLMAQAKIYWDMENYQQVEKVFRKSVEFCNDHDVWKLNVAHVLFMQENKFKEATGFYEPIVKKNYDKAEELMRKIEKEEEQLAYEEPDKKIFHLSIVNLVIGTLYCAKGNYDFGISRVIKSLEPYSKKLGTDTWFYAKRCFLSLLENLAKQVFVIRDAVLYDCLQFFSQCEAYGRNVKVAMEQPLDNIPIHAGKNTVTYEARLLKSILLEIMD